MVPAITLLAALASAGGVYLFFFDGPNDLIEQFVATFLGGQRDYRVFILVSIPIAMGLLTYVFLLHLLGRPLSIPFL